MKKTSIILAALFVMTNVAQAANNAASGGKDSTTSNKTETSQPKEKEAIPTAQPNAASEKVQEKNAVTNQGQEKQLNTQESQQTNQPDDPTRMKGNQPMAPTSGSSNAEQRRSQVATAVQSMLALADRNGGIGQQVRIVAQNQNQNQEKLEQSVAKIQSRSGLTKFFIGPDYGEIANARQTIQANREQIQQLNQIRTQLTNQADQTELQQQIQVLEKNNQSIEAELETSAAGFSLFGWLNKMMA